jgi:hypothetical protein
MLNTAKINEIAKDVFFYDSELVNANTDNAKPKPGLSVTEVKGVTAVFCFHAERLLKHKSELVAMIDELPPEFIAGEGEGAPFLNVGTDKNGRCWASNPKCMEVFCAMCIGLNLAKWRLAHEFWAMFPGRVPYIVFSKEGVKPSETPLDSLIEAMTVGQNATQRQREQYARRH